MIPPPICVIGNLNIDFVIRNVPKIPEWGQEVMGLGSDQFSSGQAGYLSMALARLGIPTSLIGNVGDDFHGRQILAELEAYGVSVEGVSCMGGAKTGISVAIVRADGERAFITDLGCLRVFSQKMVDAHWNLVENASIVCLVGLFCTPGLSFTACVPNFEACENSRKNYHVRYGVGPFELVKRDPCGFVLSAFRGDSIYAEPRRGPCNYWERISCRNGSCSAFSRSGKSCNKMWK